MNTTVERLVNKFKMKAHPEGGFFGAGYRSNEFLRSESLPDRYDAPRNLYSSIYFLVTPENPSKFHKIKTDEMWHFYKGDPLDLHILHDQDKHSKISLSDFEGSERFQFLVKKNTWMAANCQGANGYALVGCSLAPGFEYEDFELANREQLLKSYPDHEAIIRKFT